MHIVLGDITKMQTDAIVNAASSDLKPCEGVCQAIFQAADTDKLTAACKKIGRCPIGQAVITPSCGLPCKYIIHVAGAGWYNGRQQADLLFAQCYRQALQKAYIYHCRSVAVPLIFSGGMHLPRARALLIAGAVIRTFEQQFPGMEILLVLYSQKIYETALRLLGEENMEEKP